MIEIFPLKSLNAEITVPGSKYIANRVLIIAALAEGNSTIKNIPDNDDINNAITALKEFGVGIKKENNTVKINGTAGKLKLAENEIDVGESGTLLRFITGFAALADGKTTITGSKRIQQRPVLELINSLEDLGIKSRALNNGCPPVIIEEGTLKGGTTRIDGSVSSQFISSLLLSAPYAENDTEIIVENLASKSYVDMTLDLMGQFGVSVEREGYEKFRIKAGQKYISKEFTVPSDWSSANYFLAAAAIVPGVVKINGLDINSKHGEAKFADVLAGMGCKVNKGANYIQITGKNNLSAIEVDMSSMPDAVQTLAAVAAFSKGTTKIRNIGNLKYKESNRIKDTGAELKKLGLKASAGEDNLTIEGGKINPAVINPHNDHRMAMSFAIIGLKTGIKIENPECVNKSFPGFWEKLKEIGAGIKMPKNIVLIGYRGAYKSPVGREISKITNYRLISTDEEIVKKVGMPIKEYVEKEGWDEFRKRESEVVNGLENTGNSIIDCGGGVIEKGENIKNLKRNGIIFWLKASTPVIIKRIENNHGRPSLTGKPVVEEVEEVLSKRIPLYKKAADYEIDTDNKEEKEISNEVLKLIKK